MSKLPSPDKRFFLHLLADAGGLFIGACMAAAGESWWAYILGVGSAFDMATTLSARVAVQVAMTAIRNEYMRQKWEARHGP